MPLGYLLASVVLFQQAPKVPMNVPRPKVGYLLRVSGKVGDSYVYENETSMKISSGTDSFRMTAKVTETLARKFEEQIDWDSVIQLHEISGSGILEPMMAVMQKLNMQHTTSVKNDQGRLLKVIVGEIERNSRGSADVSFPKKMVAVGDSWQAPIEVGGNVVTIEYTLTAAFDYKGRKTVSIEGVYLPDQGVTNIEKNQFWVDLPTGKVVSSKVHAQVTKGDTSIEVLTTNNLVESKSGPDPIPTN